nr:HAMP domain-containing sensor histidine kinase [uncultured Agathobacter sp.]
MLKKLRRKFIAIAMLSVSIVLIAIVGTINIANYISTNKALDARLNLIAGNGGTFPDLLEQKNMGVESNKKNDENTNTGTESTNTDTENANTFGNTADESTNKRTPTLKEPPSGRTDVQPPEDMNQADLNENDLKRHGISPESQFDTRYFTVTINSKGDVENIDTSKIASVSSENAAQYAKKLWKSGKNGDGKNGFSESFKYLTVGEGGSTMYIFLSCQRELSTIRTYVLASVGISVFGLAVVFVMIYFFSGKILKPVSESYEKQKRFITDASHEIKTPLTIIDANTEVIEMMEGENEWTSSTRKQVARLTSLTEKLVFLSRMDEEATKLEMLEFSLSDAILDTAEPFKAVAGTKGKKLTIDVTDGILYTGDEKTIRQLVSILLDNAMKYSGCSSASHEKGNINKKNLNKTNFNKTNLNKTTQTQNDCVTTINPAPEIEISLKPSGKNRIITVWNTVDETANIKKGRQDMLFERFYRTDTSHNSKTGGFGIGLSAAYAIVKAHKGKITAESKDGRSIKFTIVL